jgi:SPP1 family predicted phage head-tail adaptor
VIDYGKLRHRVTLQSLGSTQDGFGQTVETWANVANVWADIQPGRGREFFAAQQTNAELTHEIVIRYRASVAPTWRVLYGTRIFDIQQVQNTGEADRRLLLMCIERNPTGA